MFKTSGIALSLLLLAGCVGTGPSDPTAFASYAGIWNGQQVRSTGTRALTITIKADGSYTWENSGVTVTGGQLSKVGDAVQYANTAGSRGVVSRPSASTLVWRNTFTGNDYTVTVTK